MRVECLQRHGELLSNTWTTYPWAADKPGKLGIIRDSCGDLEWLHDKSSGARGWVCGLSGSSGCNVPTSLRRVRVVRARARRWILRHESRPYGVQQARKLYNAGNSDKGTSSARLQIWLSRCLKSISKQGPGKTGASRRGNTGGSSGNRYYLV